MKIGSGSIRQPCAELGSALLGNALRDLARQPHGAPHTVFAVLRAYLDERGIHNDPRFCVLAGFMGTLRQWEKFSHTYLHAVGVDATDPGFHASQYFARDKQGQRTGFYRGWETARCDRLLTGLTR